MNQCSSRSQCPSGNSITPPNVWQKNQDRMKNVELNMHFRICALPPLRQSDLITLPNIWHKNQDRIKNVELYTHLRNCALPPQGPKTTIHFDNSSNDDCWWLSGVDGCQLKNEPVVDGCQMLMIVRVDGCLVDGCQLNVRIGDIVLRLVRCHWRTIWI